MKEQSPLDRELELFFDELKGTVKEIINDIVINAMKNIQSSNGELRHRINLENPILTLAFEGITISEEKLSEFLEKHPAVDHVDEDIIYFKSLETLNELGLEADIYEEESLEDLYGLKFE